MIAKPIKSINCVYSNPIYGFYGFYCEAKQFISTDSVDKRHRHIISKIYYRALAISIWFSIWLIFTPVALAHSELDHFYTSLPNSPLRSNFQPTTYLLPIMVVIGPL